MEVRSLGGISGRGHLGGHRGAGRGDDAGDIELKFAVEVGLRCFQLGDAGLHRGNTSAGGVALGDEIGGLVFRVIALCLERVDFGGKQLHFAAQRIDAGRCFIEQFGLGLVVPLQVGDLSAGFGEFVFDGLHRP